MQKNNRFFLNGQNYSTKHKLTILELINYFGYNTSVLVVEYNHLICNKENWSKMQIQNKDKIEIVTIVGGG